MKRFIVSLMLISIASTAGAIDFTARKEALKNEINQINTRVQQIDTERVNLLNRAQQKVGAWGVLDELEKEAAIVETNNKALEKEAE